MHNSFELMYHLPATTNVRVFPYLTLTFEFARTNECTPLFNHVQVNHDHEHLVLSISENEPLNVHILRQSDK